MEAHPTLGFRRICPKCQAPHYDLNKNPSSCPKCQHSYDPTVPYEAVKRGRKSAKRIEDSADNAKESALIDTMKEDDDDEENAVKSPDIEPIEDLDDRAEEEMSGIASKAGASIDGDDAADGGTSGDTDGLIDEIEEEIDDEDE